MFLYIGHLCNIYFKERKIKYFIFICEKKNPQSAGDGVEKREASYTVGGNANWYNQYGRLYEDSLKS